MRIRGSVPLIKNRTWILLFSLFACDRKNNNGSIREASVVDPHHFDGDPDADPDSTYHADAVMDADPDPSLKIGSNPWKGAKIGSYSVHSRLTSAYWCGSGSGSGSSLYILMRMRIQVTKMMRIHNTARSPKSWVSEHWYPPSQTRSERRVPYWPGEGHAVVLQLYDGSGRLAGHVVDCVLVTQPVRTFHRVVHVPPAHSSVWINILMWRAGNMPRFAHYQGWR